MDTKVLSALAEPNRLRIIELLSRQPYSVNEVSQLLKIRQPQVSKHLNTLTKAGLVNIHPVAQQRIYSLSPQPFIELKDWANSFQQYWGERLDNLDNYLKKG